MRLVVSINAGLLLALGIFATPSIAQQDPDWKACNSSIENPNAGILGCTRIIARGNRETSKNQAIAHARRGLAYSKQGDSDRAIADLSAAISLDPISPVWLYWRGIEYTDKGDLERAITDFSEAIRLRPKTASYYTARGVAYEKRGEKEKALADFRLAASVPVDQPATRQAEARPVESTAPRPVQVPKPIAVRFFKGGKPSPDNMRQLLEDQIDSEAFGRLRLAGFEKTNGFDMVIPQTGAKGYSMEWHATVEAAEDCKWKTEMAIGGGGGVVGFMTSPPAEDFRNSPNARFSWSTWNETTQNPGLSLRKGERRTIEGKTQFMSTENGWRVVGKAF